MPLSWGPLLKDVSRLDNNGLEKSNSLGQKIKQQLEDGQFVDATNSWSELEEVISASSSSVSRKGKLSLPYYAITIPDRFELDAFDLEILAIRRYSRYLSYLKSATTPDGDGDLDGLMNGEIKKKLKIILENVTQVFFYLFSNKKWK
ncbi:hypothetical protein Pint_25391 [Pistacia integerrima]|uniref:Uncharacterized protein n=1 Tax=Pistacia integerrima TaxID=434235 RepID=A0ACC0YFK1_9ROSI|nr:hypothetical protein Pint_25391 [Pistacia integerrima]